MAPEPVSEGGVMAGVLLPVSDGVELMGLCMPGLVLVSTSFFLHAASEPAATISKDNPIVLTVFSFEVIALVPFMVPLSDLPDPAGP
jgi:hypothetical protein